MNASGMEPNNTTYMAFHRSMRFLKEEPIIWRPVLVVQFLMVSLRLVQSLTIHVLYSCTHMFNSITQLWANMFQPISAKITMGWIGTYFQLHGMVQEEYHPNDE